MHYNTWDLIRADPEEFKRLVGSKATVTILSPGESHTLS
jgi:L-ascorbate metabolism protein UlaG (beta-lactamase superfamily)